MRAAARAAQDHFYSMELEDAATSYTQLLAADPENPDYWTGLAHVRLFQQLKRLGKFDNDVYSAAAEVAPVAPSYDPAVVQSMWDALGKARAICEKRLAANPRDLDANYFLGVSYAIESNYQVSVTRQYFDALAPATKAKDYHLKVLQIDPYNHDANLVVGTYEYGIGSIPFAFRWIVRMVGHSGTKEHGIELIRDALVNGKRGPAAPLMMLAYIHNREKQYDYSRQMLDQLARFYPRNSFYELQMASSFRKAGDLDSAAEVYQRVEKRVERGDEGYTQVDLPRLRYQIAAVFESLRKKDLALNYYRLILPWENGQKGGRETPQPLQANAYLHMANLRRELGHRDAAREFYQKALEYPMPEVQKAARIALKKLNEQVK
ncbi:MAG: tetratricopeptide repeat protein [Acidobacteria bacterium]|nr:tetratricopeptide repeat protein [Acidobacteriota bacterium]